MIPYLISVAIFGTIYGLLAIGLNVQWGMTGLVNFGQVAFFAVGAYASAIPSHAGWPLWMTIPFAMLLSALVGAVVAATTLRLRQDFLALVTLGFGEVVRLSATNEMWLTGGAGGLPAIPRLLPGEPGPFEDLPFLALALAMTAVILWLVHLIGTAPFGRILRAIKEDEVVARFLGRSVFAFKLKAFALGAAIAGLAGALFAHYITLVAPEQFLPIVTVYTWIAVMLGGQRSAIGAFVGAMVLMAILELTRFAKDYLPGLQAEQLAATRVILIGVVLVFIVKRFPNGVLMPGSPRR